jgi:hypothetical protein
VNYVRVASLISWPSLAILAVVAPYIPRVLGPQWAGVEYALAVLAICGAIETLTQFVGPVLQSLGRPGALAAIVWLQGLVGAALFTGTAALSAGAGVPMQAAAIGGAKGFLFLLLLLPALLFYSRTLLELPAQAVLRAVVPAALCASVVYVFGIALREGLGVSRLHVIVQAILLVLPLGLTWIAGMVVLSSVARRIVLGAARKYSPMFLIRS